MQLIYTRLFFVFCIAGILYACGSPGDSGTTQPEETQGPPVVKEINYEEATANMAYRISRAYENIDPARATFLIDDKRIEMFKQQMQSQDLQTRIVAWSHYAYELLNAGKTERAIGELE